MKSLDDDLWLSELAIPGAHDSAVYHSKTIASNYVDKQCLSFKELQKENLKKSSIINLFLYPFVIELLFSHNEY